jgi:hypothetical protein
VPLARLPQEVVKLMELGEFTTDERYHFCSL